MYLSDGGIRWYLAAGSLAIDPTPPDGAFQPASVEYRIDWGSDCECGVPDCIDGQMVLLPGEFRLAHTLERITIPDDLLVRAEGKSSWARLGLLVHATAGHLDPGFSGQVTLELKNLHHKNPITVNRHDVIGQFLVCRLSSPVLRPYGHPELGNHYQGQVGTTRSWMERP